MDRAATDRTPSGRRFWFHNIDYANHGSAIARTINALGRLSLSRLASSSGRMLEICRRPAGSRRRESFWSRPAMAARLIGEWRPLSDSAVVSAEFDAGFFLYVQRLEAQISPPAGVASR
jgi:hypothetical protein